MKECKVCKQDAGFYWKFVSGDTIYLCREHFVAMEKDMHQQEKSKRLAEATFSVLTGKQYPKEECPNGKGCNYCKEFGL
jgi:hypothetical protein